MLCFVSYVYSMREEEGYIFVLLIPPQLHSPKCFYCSPPPLSESSKSGLFSKQGIRDMFVLQSGLCKQTSAQVKSMATSLKNSSVHDICSWKVDVVHVICSRKVSSAHDMSSRKVEIVHDICSRKFAISMSYAQEKITVSMTSTHENLTVSMTSANEKLNVFMTSA